MMSTNRFLTIWDKCDKLISGTAGWELVIMERGLSAEQLGDLSHVLRWHRKDEALIALMTNPLTGEPVGIRRSFIWYDDMAGACVVKRDIVGTWGVVRLNEDVSTKMRVCEHTEEGLELLLVPGAPVWVVADGFDALPVLPGVEELAIYARPDRRDAAAECVKRWREAGRDAEIRLVRATLHAWSD